MPRDMSATRSSVTWSTSPTRASGRASTRTLLIVGAVAVAVVVVATAIVTVWPSSEDTLTVGGLTVEYPPGWETNELSTYARAASPSSDPGDGTVQGPWFSVEEFSTAPRVLSAMESDVSGTPTADPPVIVEAPHTISVNGQSAVAMTWTLDEWTTRTIVLTPAPGVAHQMLFRARTSHWNGMSDVFSRILESVRFEGAQSTAG